MRSATWEARSMFRRRRVPVALAALAAMCGAGLAACAGSPQSVAVSGASASAGGGAQFGPDQTIGRGGAGGPAASVPGAQAPASDSGVATLDIGRPQGRIERRVDMAYR